MTTRQLTPDQRDMAITMLANALRRQTPPAPASEPAAGIARQAGQQRRQAEADAYVRGMIDLLAVLFAGGRPVAEALLAEARVVARGRPPSAEHPELN